MNETQETLGGVKIYNVKTDIFNGPFEVLLDLIEKRKLFINDISLAQVTDDFIKYIQENINFPMQESAHFIMIASTLILIKSRSLLPSINLTEEEEESIEDLNRRLRIYKAVKKESERLSSVWLKEKLFWGCGESIPIETSFTPDESITQNNLKSTAYELIKNLPNDAIIPKVKVNDVVKLETVINSLIRRVDSEIKMSFKKFSGINKRGGVINKKEKYMVVVSFIALLELVKQGMVTAEQREEDSDIYIENCNIKTPNYT